MLFGALPLPIARAGASQKHSPAFCLYARLVRRSEQPNHLYSIFRPLLTSLVRSSLQTHLPRPNFPSSSSYHNCSRQHGICCHPASHSSHTSGRSQDMISLGPLPCKLVVVPRRPCLLTSFCPSNSSPLLVNVEHSSMSTSARHIWEPARPGCMHFFAMHRRDSFFSIFRDAANLNDPQDRVMDQVSGIARYTSRG